MTPDLRRGAWRKSSYSNGQNGSCVEVAFADDRAMIRDSKNATGTPLTFDTVDIAAFISRIKAGRFDA